MAVHFSAASWLHVDWARRLQQTITGQIARIEIVKVSGHDGWEWLIPSIKMLSTFALLDLIDINFRSDISAIVMHQRTFAAPLQATQIQPSTCSNFVSCVVPMEYPHSMCLPSLSHESREEMRRWLLFTRIINKNIITICLVHSRGDLPSITLKLCAQNMLTLASCVGKKVGV